MYVLYDVKFTQEMLRYAQEIINILSLYETEKTENECLVFD